MKDIKMKPRFNPGDKVKITDLQFKNKTFEVVEFIVAETGVWHYILSDIKDPKYQIAVPFFDVRALNESDEKTPEEKFFDDYYDLI